MYCYNCGNFFPDDEATDSVGELGEPILTCPYCGVDDLGPSETCELCGEEFADGETRNGFCLSCLWAEIDYDLTLEYLKDTEQLAEFLIEYIFDAGRIEHSSFDLDRHLEETFRRMVANDKLCGMCGGSYYFLERCKYYCLPYYNKGDFGIEGGEFADWFDEHLKKQNRKEKTK